MKTFLRRFLWTLGALALLVFLFHLVETWRGRRAWAERKRAQEAAGVDYDPASCAPKVIPDAENFAAAPFVADMVAGRESGVPAMPKEAQDVVFALVSPPFGGSWRQGRRTDFPSVEAKFKGARLEALLTPLEPRLGQLAEGARRPGCRIPVDYRDRDAIPAMLGMRSWARALSARALLRLHEGRQEAALEDLLTGLRVAHHLRGEPHLITQLLRMAWVNILLQPIWEGLQAQAWNEAQLARLEAALAPIDLLASMKLAWRFERIGSAALWGRIASDPSSILSPEGSGKGRLARWANRVAFPQGWVFQNMVTQDRAFEAWMEAPLDIPGHRVHREVIEAARARATRWSPYTWWTSMAIPALLAQTLRLARYQSGLDQARVACALERHRLALGGYPGDLASLAPRFLSQVPHDLVTGAPLRYAPLGRSFKLYSLGWNGTDEGGQIEPDPKAGITLEQGDWVWSTGK